MTDSAVSPAAVESTNPRLLEMDKLLTLAKFDDDEIELFARQCLDDEVTELHTRIAESETELRHLRGALAQSNKELTDLTRLHGADASEHQKEVDRLRSMLREKIEEAKKLDGHCQKYREENRTLHSQLANQKPPSPDLEALQDYVAGIRPDPRCTVSGCWGKRGYSGFTADIDPKTGHKTIRVNLCCGKVGESDYALIARKFADVHKQLQEQGKVILTAYDVTFRHTTFGGIKHGWNKARTFFARLLSGLRSKKVSSSSVATSSN